MQAAAAGQMPGFSPQLPPWQSAQQQLQPHQGSFLQQPTVAQTNNFQFPYSGVSLGAFPAVPSRFITQIQRGEFVNFDSLFSSLVHGSSGKQGYSLALDDKDDNDMPTISILKQSSEKGKIKNFASWSRAWNTFMTIFVHFRPHLVSQLMSYQNSITQLASTYYAQYWLAYDAAFRQKMANNQFLRWDIEDTFLFNSYLRAAPVLASAALPVSSASTGTTSSSSKDNGRCFQCGKFGHFQKRCPNYGSLPPPPPPPLPPTAAWGQANSVPRSSSQQGNNGNAPFRVPQRGTQRSGINSGVCFPWNNGEQCPDNCRRVHKCSFCGDLHARCICDKWLKWLEQQNQQN